MENQLKITGIIDATKNLVLGLGDHVKADTKTNGKKRRLDTVVFVLTTLATRAYDGATSAPTQMSLADKLKMKGFMALNGTDANLVDYSVRNNSYYFEVPKNVLEELVGQKYEDIDFESLLGKDANQEFVAFKEVPHRVRVDEVVASTFAVLPESEKANYQEKQLPNGTKLTKGGEQIFRATFLDEQSWGIEDSVLKQDQDLSLATQKAEADLVGKA